MKEDRAGWDGGRHGRGCDLHGQSSWMVRHAALEVHRGVQKEPVLGQCCLAGARGTAMFHHAELKVKMR